MNSRTEALRRLSLDTRPSISAERLESLAAVFRERGLTVAIGG